MATMAATLSAVAPATSLVAKPLRTSRPGVASRVQGLPALQVSRIVCSAEKKQQAARVPAAAAVAAATSFIAAHPALALVDERLSGEGTGLPLGLSGPALGWVLVGTAGLIWAFYFAYSQNLPEGDDDSGLSL